MSAPPPTSSSAKVIARRGWPAHHAAARPKTSGASDARNPGGRRAIGIVCAATVVPLLGEWSGGLEWEGVALALAGMTAALHQPTRKGTQ